MDEGINRKRKALELPGSARVHVCPAGFVQAEAYSADRCVIIRRAAEQKHNASVLSTDFLLHAFGEVNR